MEFEVSRVYRIAPDSWEGPNATGKWQFSGVELSPAQIDEAFELGELPAQLGDPCKTRWRRS
ncbi:hypothetical protein [Nocardia sp. NPDC059229]|uniref:hypothetical protein n=1 Tax=Nocardia sp. NPDC059229 TaxID=3346778 RepID=UPI00369382FE